MYYIQNVTLDVIHVSVQFSTLQVLNCARFTMCRNVSAICKRERRAGSFRPHVSFFPRNNYVLSLAPEDEVTVIQWQPTPPRTFLSVRRACLISVGSPCSSRLSRQSGFVVVPLPVSFLLFFFFYETAARKG